MSRHLSTRNISSKSMHGFLSNLANRQTDRQTDKVDKRGQTHLPPPLSEVIRIRCFDKKPCCRRKAARLLCVCQYVERKFRFRFTLRIKFCSFLFSSSWSFMLLAVINIDSLICVADWRCVCSKLHSGLSHLLFALQQSSTDSQIC